MSKEIVCCNCCEESKFLNKEDVRMFAKKVKTSSYVTLKEFENTKDKIRKNDLQKYEFYYEHSYKGQKKTYPFLSKRLNKTSTKLCYRCYRENNVKWDKILKGMNEPVKKWEFPHIPSSDEEEWCQKNMKEDVVREELIKRRKLKEEFWKESLGLDFKPLSSEQHEKGIFEIKSITDAMFDIQGGCRACNVNTKTFTRFGYVKSEYIGAVTVLVFRCENNIHEKRYMSSSELGDKSHRLNRELYCDILSTGNYVADIKILFREFDLPFLSTRQVERYSDMLYSTVIDMGKQNDEEYMNLMNKFATESNRPVNFSFDGHNSRSHRKNIGSAPVCDVNFMWSEPNILFFQEFVGKEDIWDPINKKIIAKDPNGAEIRSKEKLATINALEVIKGTIETPGLICTDMSASADKWCDHYFKQGNPFYSKKHDTWHIFNPKYSEWSGIANARVGYCAKTGVKCKKCNKRWTGGKRGKQKCTLAGGGCGKETFKSYYSVPLYPHFRKFSFGKFRQYWNFCAYQCGGEKSVKKFEKKWLKFPKWVEKEYNFKFDRKELKRLKSFLQLFKSQYAFASHLTTGEVELFHAHEGLYHTKGRKDGKRGYASRLIMAAMDWNEQKIEKMLDELHNTHVEKTGKDKDRRPKRRFRSLIKHFYLEQCAKRKKSNAEKKDMSFVKVFPLLEDEIFNFSVAVSGGKIKGFESGEVLNGGYEPLNMHNEVKDQMDVDLELYVEEKSPKL